MPENITRRYPPELMERAVRMAAEFVPGRKRSGRDGSDR